MGYRNPYGSELYRTAQLLSQRVSEKDKFFQDIALMGVDDRTAYAILYAIIETKILDKDIMDMNFKQLIEEIVMPIIQRVGQAKFKADPLTHLGMKLGNPSESQDYGRE